MIESYKGRQLEKGMMVEVYYNLHKQVFSVKDAKSGLVLGHGNEIRLRNPEFKVNEGGRQRVIREQKKNVHATVIGEYVGRGLPTEEWTPLYYNPYTQSEFTVRGYDHITANSQGYTEAILMDKRTWGIRREEEVGQHEVIQSQWVKDLGKSLGKKLLPF